MATFACECIQSGPAPAAPGRTVSIIQNTPADQKEVMFLSLGAAVGFTPLEAFAHGQRGADRQAYKV